MNELWVARDVAGFLELFIGNPEFDGSDWFCSSPDVDFLRTLPNTMYTDLRPGECKRLFLAEEQ